MLQNFNPVRLFLVIIHADLMPMEENHILEKLESFKKYGNIDISRENVILFNKTPKSLYPLMKKITGFEDRGEMKFYEAKELVDRANKVLNELPGDF